MSGEDLLEKITKELKRYDFPPDIVEGARNILGDCYQKIKDLKERTRKDYYLPRSTFWRKLICALRFFPLFIGHDFEHIYSRGPDDFSVEGEHALVCRICYRVENHGPFTGFLPNIGYGSSPMSARTLPVRKVTSVTEELKNIGER